MSTTPKPRPGTSRDPVPEHFQRLVDDAAIFPPGDAPLPRAVTEHRDHAASRHADLVGPFVVNDVRLPELVEAVQAGDRTADPLPVIVVVSGGAGALEPAVRWATRAEELRLAGLEIALRDEADLAHNARRVVTAVDQLVAAGELDDEVPVHVEPPRVFDQPVGHSWLAALDEIAAMDLRLKLRTGGTDAHAFPGSSELAGYISAALDRELRFKCTAGLHHAVRHHDAHMGFEHHGFLNVLLATRSSLDGAAPEDLAAVLDVQDSDEVAARVREAGDESLASARRWFTSFGSCSVREPLEDLLDLGLLPNLPLEHL